MKIPGDDQRITNTDEQEVAVNSSTNDENGFDEPIHHGEEAAARSKQGNDSSDESVKDKKRTAPEPQHYKAN